MIDIHPDIWVTSDHHWSHEKIREYQGRPVDHFEIMRDRWFQTVGPEDTVLHLGDLVYKGDPKGDMHWLENLPGQKYMIRGNHDKYSDEWYEQQGFTMLGRAGFTWIDETTSCIVYFSHEPDLTVNGWDINVHGHIHGNAYWQGTPMADYRNVCVEVTGYRPVKLRGVLYGNLGRRRLDYP